jgi:hypothetical protein
LIREYEEWFTLGLMRKNHFLKGLIYENCIGFSICITLLTRNKTLGITQMLWNI